MAGYSPTPLARKLGVVEDTVVGMIGEPSGFVDLLEPLPDGVTFTQGEARVIIVFATDAETLETRFAEAMDRIPADGAIWVGWPKKSSSVPSEITENDLRALLLPTGLVDNKVCAIDDDWSGLRFVVRKEHRSAWPR